MVTSFKVAHLGLLLVTLASCGKDEGLPIGAGTGSSGSGGPCTSCKIFVTSSVHTGALSSYSGADAICNADAESGADTYKALLGGRSDWPLQANTLYVNASGQTIGTTDGASQLTFPLTNAIGNGLVWTGIAANWATFNTCLSWSSSSGGENSNLGNATSTNSGMLNASIQTCNNTFALYCVQQ